MAYVKQTWQTGDVVTSAKLNHMEDGIAAGGGALIVDMEYNDQDKYVLSKTWNEIKTALSAGTPVYLRNLYDEDGYTEIVFGPVLYCFSDGTHFSLAAHYGTMQESHHDFLTDSADGYPVDDTQA